MKRKIFLAGLTLILGASMVFAGGGSQQSGGGGAAASNKTITINTIAGVGQEAGWKAIADAYKKHHPEVNIVIDLKPNEGYRDWVINLFNVSNPTADIINVNWSKPQSYGKSIDFVEYLDQKSPYSNGKWRDQFNVDMQAVEMWNGQMPSISLSSVQVLWLYNKDIFAKVGVQPPKTWNEFIAVCDKLEKAGYQPLSISGDYPSFNAGEIAWLNQVYFDQTSRAGVNIIRAQPGDYNYDPDLDGKWKYDPADPYNDDKVTLNPVRFFKAIAEGQLKLDSPGEKAVWSNFAKIFPRYAGGDNFFGTSSSTPLFYQGKAAIKVDGAWGLMQFKTDMDKLSKGQEVTVQDKAVTGIQKFELGTFNMPSMEGPEFVSKARTLEVATGFLGAVKKDRAHDDLVADFFMFLSSTEGWGAFMNAAIGDGGTVDGPSLVYGLQLPADIQSLFKDLVFIGNVQKGYLNQLPWGLGDQNVRNFYDYTYNYLTGRITIDQWLTAHGQNNDLDYLMAANRVSRNDLRNPQNAPTGQ
jgi:ABC-type glycerol-3-phosphate transport system substrate-binding protein